MNSMFKAAALTCAIAAAWPATDARAAVIAHGFFSNAVNYCQAFTPGVSNTVRNRVVGAENVGSSPIAVACNFHSLLNAASSTTLPTSVQLWFANNNTSGTITVTCTLLTSFQGSSSSYVSTKTTATIPAGGVTQRSLTWTATDNPTSGATNLGSDLIGVNCTLPAGGVINDTNLLWNQDNGVGN